MVFRDSSWVLFRFLLIVASLGPFVASFFAFLGYLSFSYPNFWYLLAFLSQFVSIFWICRVPEPSQNLENQWKTIGFLRFFAIFIICLRSKKIFQKCFQNGPWKPARTPKNPPRASQDASRWLQNVSKMPQVPPKMPPRPLQDLQNAFKSAQDASKLPQEPPKTLPRPSVTWFLVVLGRFGGDFPVPSSDHLRAIWNQV